jgi:hypothetical protein
MDVAHRVVWFAIDLMESIFGRVESLYAHVGSSILDCGLSI